MTGALVRAIVWAAALLTPGAAAAQQTTLWMGYRLPANPDLEANARLIEAGARTQRTGMLAMCASSADKASCELQAEITFRGHLLAIPGLTFGLYHDPGLGYGLKWILDASGEAAVDPDWDQHFYRLEPGRVQQLGIHIDLGSCRFLRDGDRRPIRYGGILARTVCHLVRRREDAKAAFTEMFFYGSASDPRLNLNADQVAFLLDHGASLDVKSGMIAVESKFRETASGGKYLAVNGAETYLIRAIKIAGDEVVRVLIDRGADVNAKDSYEETALMVAAERGRTHVVRLLLDRGADVSATDDTGETALQKALKAGRVDAVSLLRQHGGV